MAVLLRHIVVRHIVFDAIQIRDSSKKSSEYVTPYVTFMHTQSVTYRIAWIEPQST
jgi:hypothetical protein